MKSIVFYLVQVTAASGILYGYYHFVLRNKKFHHYNRFYLLLAVIVSLFIPFLNIPVYFSESSPAPAVLHSWNLMITGSSIADADIQQVVHPRNNWFTWQNVSSCFYIFISLLILLRIIFSLNRIRLIIRKNTAEKLDDIHFINTNEPGTPFSFFNWLFWNRNIELRSEKGEQVFRHELFHIQQKHSWDVIFMQLVTMIFWINPFFHLIKKELKAIHEFLADEFAITENQKWQYAEFLLMQALNTQNHLIHPFFNTQIKRRIAMITTSKKPSYQYTRKIMVLPIAAIVLGLFAFSYKEREKRKQEQKDNGELFFASDTTKPKDRILIQETGPAVPGGNIPRPRPFPKAVPSAEQLKSWQDVKMYGVWIDEKRVENAQLAVRQPADFSHFFLSRLSKTAVNYGKHYYQVDLMTNAFYEQYVRNFEAKPPKIVYTVTKFAAPDTIPKITQKFRDALIIIDGKETTADELDKMDVSTIGTIQILKDGEATKEYGDKGKNGGIRIFTKDFKKNSREPILMEGKIRYHDGKKSGEADSSKPKSYFYFDEKNKVYTGYYNGTKVSQIIVGKSNDVKLTLVTGAEVTLRMKDPFEMGLPFNELRQPFKYNEKGYKIIVGKNQNGETIAIAYKEKAVSVLHFSGSDDIKKWEAIYGKVPPPPPPPPLSNTNETPQKNLDYVWTKVEIAPSFPDGFNAWAEFVKENLNQAVASKAPPGTYAVFVQFIVDEKGNLADIKPLTNYGYGMEEEALRVFRKVPKWIPAKQNGHQVKAYARWAVDFYVTNKETQAAGKNPTISANDLRNVTPFSLLRLTPGDQVIRPGEELISFTLIFETGKDQVKKFNIIGDKFPEELQTMMKNIQTTGYIYIEDIQVKSFGIIQKRHAIYYTVIPTQSNAGTGITQKTEFAKLDFNDPEFKRKWRQMIDEVKALAWKEGKAAYEYKGRTYVFGQIKSDDPKIAGFTEQNGIGHVFVLNGELVNSAEELNRLIKRKDVMKFGFIKPEEALKKYNRNEVIAYVETETAMLTRK